MSYANHKRRIDDAIQNNEREQRYGEFEKGVMTPSLCMSIQSPTRYIVEMLNESLDARRSILVDVCIRQGRILGHRVRVFILGDHMRHSIA